MALKRKVAFGVILIMVLVVVAVLPPRSCSVVERWTLTEQAMCSNVAYRGWRSHRRALDRADGRLTLRLQEYALADSLRALADAGRGVRAADGSVVVLHEVPLSADSARVWLALAVGERDRLATGRPRARIVLALESHPARAARERSGQLRRSYYPQPEARRFIRVSGGDTTCYVTLRLDSRGRNSGDLVETDDRGQYGAFLGLCGLVGRFGHPSAAIHMATRFALGNDRASYYLRRTTMVSSGTAEPRPADPADYRLIGCVKGESDACEAAVGLGSARTRSWYGGGLYVSREFLSYLQETEDPEKFQRFWQSPLDGERALADAFGRPAAETVRAWAQRDFRLPDDDPIGVGAMAVAALGWLSAALIAAVAIGVRRQASP